MNIKINNPNFEQEINISNISGFKTGYIRHNVISTETYLEMGDKIYRLSSHALTANRRFQSMTDYYNRHRSISPAAICISMLNNYLSSFVYNIINNQIIHRVIGVFIIENNEQVEYYPIILNKNNNITKNLYLEQILNKYTNVYIINTFIDTVRNFINIDPNKIISLNDPLEEYLNRS